MKWLGFILIFKIAFGRFLEINVNEEQQIQNDVMDCVQTKCVYQDEALINICQGLDICANSKCQSQLQLDNFKNYQKCNQDCLNPIIQGLSERDKEVVTGHYNCRIQCTKQVIQNHQNNYNSDSDNDDMRLEAIFISISIFVALGLGIAMYIWCSIYHRRQQDVIIIPGQIHPDQQQQNSAQNQDNQEVLQSRLTDPDKIFVVEGSAILHQNQKIIPKLGFNIPQGIVVGTQLNLQKNQEDKCQPVSLQIVDTTLIELNQLSVYNNLSMVDNGSDFNNNLINNSFANNGSLGNLDNNERQINQNQQNTNNNNQQVINSQYNQNVPVGINSDINNISLRPDQQQPNINQGINQQNQNNIDRSHFVITNLSPFVIADRSPYLQKQKNIIPIHDVQITPIIQSEKPPKELINKIEDNQVNKTANHNLDNYKLDSENNDIKSLDLDQAIKSKNLLGAEFVKRSSKCSSKRHSHRNSILANLENRVIQNKRKSGQFTDSTEEKQQDKELSRSGEESEYEYYYETESSGESSDESNEGDQKIQEKIIRKSKEINKDQITLQIPEFQGELHLSEEEKPAEKKEANNISLGSNNKCNGSTEETIAHICSTSQNFGQSGFTVRYYSSEKNKELPNITDRFNESQKIMITKSNNKITYNDQMTSNEITLSCSESPTNEFSQSQTLSPKTNQQNKQLPQKLVLKACDNNTMNVMQSDIRKKSSSLDLSALTPKEKKQVSNEEI